MDSQFLDRMIEILETDPDFYVPIRKLWLILQSEGLELNQEDFQQKIQKDKRFEIEPGVEPNAGLDTDPTVATEMESLGFYSGPRVKLAARAMTAKDIFAGMTRSLNQMNQALQSAWETRPSEDQETEDQLLAILASGQRLEREIQSLVDQTPLSPNNES